MARTKQRTTKTTASRSGATKNKRSAGNSAPSKSAGREGATRKVAPKRSTGKKRAPKKKTRGSRRLGTAQTRRIAKEMTDRVLNECKNLGPTEAGELLGLEAYDIKNLRTGFHLTLPLVVKLIRGGRYTPESIVNGPSLKKLPRGASTRAADVEAIDKRVKKISSSRPAYEWADASGLSVNTIYAVRSAYHRTGLHTVLGFVQAGVPIKQIILGKK